MTIQELAAQLAEAEFRVRMLGEMCQPTKYEDRLKADARFRLANDALDKARHEYGHVMSKMTASQLLELSK